MTEQAGYVEYGVRCPDGREGRECYCTVGSVADHIPCGRCYALGRLADEVVER